MHRSTRWPRGLLGFASVFLTHTHQKWDIPKRTQVFHCLLIESASGNQFQLQQEFKTKRIYMQTGAGKPVTVSALLSFRDGKGNSSSGLTGFRNVISPAGLRVKESNKTQPSNQYAISAWIATFQLIQFSPSPAKSTSSNDT